MQLVPITATTCRDRRDRRRRGLAAVGGADAGRSGLVLHLELDVVAEQLTGRRIEGLVEVVDRELDPVLAVGAQEGRVLADRQDATEDGWAPRPRPRCSRTRPRHSRRPRRRWSSPSFPSFPSRRPSSRRHPRRRCRQRPQGRARRSTASNAKSLRVLIRPPFGLPTVESVSAGLPETRGGAPGLPQGACYHIRLRSASRIRRQGVRSRSVGRDASRRDRGAEVAGEPERVVAAVPRAAGERARCRR